MNGNSQQGTLNEYSLDYLRRGQFSSPIVAHASGDTFIRLDSQVYQFSYDPSLAQNQIWFKFTSFNLLHNQVQTLDEVTAYPFQVIGSNLANNMTLDSILGTGGNADIRIYQKGQAVGTPGSATLVNGATLTLPAVTQTGEALSTLYYVNFNQVANSYVFYTSYNEYLTDEQTLNYIRIGQVTTASEVELSGPVSIDYWGDSPHSGPTGVYIWKNVSDASGTGPVRTPGTQVGTSMGNSLIFYSPTTGSPSTPMEWAVFTGSNITGTMPVFTPALEPDGYSDFNLCITGSFLISQPGPYTFSIDHFNDILWGIGGDATWPGQGTIQGAYSQTVTVENGFQLLPGSGSGNATNSVVVTFAAAGTYPFEIDYDYWYHSGRTLVVTCNGNSLAPASM